MRYDEIESDIQIAEKKCLIVNLEISTPLKGRVGRIGIEIRRFPNFFCIAKKSSSNTTTWKKCSFNSVNAFQNNRVLRP